MPLTMCFQPCYLNEWVICANHLLTNDKDANNAVLYQNDDYGKDYYNGLKDGLGKDVGRIVKEGTYEVTDPTVDSQVIQMKDSGANVFFNVSIPKFAPQAIRNAADTNLTPGPTLNNVSP